MHKLNGHRIEQEARPDHLQESTSDEMEFASDEEQLRQIEREAYRDAAHAMMRVFNAALAHIISAQQNPRATMKDALTNSWQVAYAVGSFICEGRSVTERAFQIGVEKATLSKGMIAFCVGNHLPPSEYMKDADTMEAYRRARLKSIKENQ